MYFLGRSDTKERYTDDMDRQGILNQPSAWVPILMSGFVIAMEAYLLLQSGGVIVHAEDEGIAAHLFQILTGGQLPFIAYFAFNWLPRAPKYALTVLFIQFLVGVI